jgi:cbb3-type cytochrome oxidase subunit 3
MAKKRQSTGPAIDWYLVSIERLKQIGIVILVLLLGGGAWWFYSNQKRNPRSSAEAAIAEARQALNTLAASKDFPSHRSDFDRAQHKLDEAGTKLAAGNYPEAESAAVESQTFSRAALSGKGGAENDAQFLTVEGDVQYQKSSTSDWTTAESRTPLFNGDWVKTGRGASAELIFSNGSLYTIGANALLEVYSQFNPSTSRKNNSVQMQVGSVEVATTDDASSVRTPGSQVTIDSESTTQVGVDPQKTTAVLTEKGSASVTPSDGGAVVKLAVGDKITATPQGALSAVRKLPMPPALLTPSDNQVFLVTADSRVQFSWDAVPGAAGYQLQVSRSRLFTSLEINSQRQKTTASAQVTAEGAFYWRVAATSGGEIGPFSAFRRFRVNGAGHEGTPAPDAPAPLLTLKRPYPIGGPFYMIEGNTDPGATVLINDEDADVEADGHFKKLVSFNKIGRNLVVVKATNAAGKQTRLSETVNVEE